MKLKLSKSEATTLEEILDQLCWDQENIEAFSSTNPPHDFELDEMAPILDKVRKILK